MGKTSRRVNLSLYCPCPVSRGRSCTTSLLQRWGEMCPARTSRRAWHRPPAHPRFLPHALSETRKWRSLHTPPSSQGRSHGAWLRGTETSTNKRRPALQHVTLPVTCFSAIRANQRQHHVYIPSAVMFSQREDLQGSRTLASNPFFLLRCHALGRRAIHLWFVVMERITSGLQNKTLLRNNGIFCLWSWSAPFIYTRDQQSLAAHHQGHQATASSQNHEVFTLNRKEKWERERTRHSCPETEANSWPVPQAWKGKASALTTYPLIFPGQTASSEGPNPSKALFSTHTTREMLKHGLVLSMGRSYQVAKQRDPLQIGYRKHFSTSQRGKTGLESLLDQVVLLQRLHPRAQTNL